MIICMFTYHYSYHLFQVWEQTAEGTWQCTASLKVLVLFFLFIGEIGFHVGLIRVVSSVLHILLCFFLSIDMAVSTTINVLIFTR